MNCCDTGTPYLLSVIGWFLLCVLANQEGLVEVWELDLASFCFGIGCFFYTLSLFSIFLRIHKEVQPRLLFNACLLRLLTDTTVPSSALSSPSQHPLSIFIALVCLTPARSGSGSSCIWSGTQNRRHGPIHVQMQHTGTLLNPSTGVGWCPWASRLHRSARLWPWSSLYIRVRPADVIRVGFHQHWLQRTTCVLWSILALCISNCCSCYLWGEVPRFAGFLSF